ncbi:hypothetical protein PVAND_014666 [Polypedilum vanderplanki]|uniref:Uncharacterized protein n=1 Tax=Polypedilum vanderplanki TaxID=319348 RepID=A0A9J6BAC3_POLVA|nr:hypothetical protein PVAND_014666 [Polypedilum vanderplanki]
MALNKMNIKSKFYDQGWSPFFEWEYMCEVTKKCIPKSSREINFVGKHSQSRADFHVAKLRFYKCLMIKIPTGLIELFPNLTSLRLSKCNLRKISREDLENLPNLRDLRVEDDCIEELPGDLIVNLYELKALSFKNNKIKFIHPEIIEYLDKLQYFNLNGNSNISMSYNPKMGVATSMYEIKIEILKKCAPPISYERAISNLNQIYPEISFIEPMTYSNEAYERQEPYNPRLSSNLLYPELTGVVTPSAPLVEPSAPDIDREYFSDYRQSGEFTMNRESGFYEPPPPYDFHERESYVVK